MTNWKDIVQQKKELRNLIKEQLSEFRKKTVEFENFSKMACDNFLKSQLYSDCKILLAFVSLKNEINTNIILQTALNQGKIVAIPRVVSETEMEFFFLQNQISLEKQLVPGAFGILEPAVFLQKAEPSEISNEKTLMLLPGLAFSPAGFRLGKGKGYYDRYLSNCQKIQLCGFCFNFQIVQQVPFNNFDKTVQYLCTEKSFEKIAEI